MRRFPAILIAGALLAAAATVPSVANQATEAETDNPAADWQVVFEDDFEGEAGTLPNSSNWLLIEGTAYPGGPANYGTGEKQNNTARPENVSLDGEGNVRITALRDAAGDSTDPEVGWTAARIETQRADFKAPAGGVMAVEGRLRLPDLEGDAALGYWPAFWMKPADLRANRWDWPRSGEFDIVENVQGKHDELWQVLHCGLSGASWGGPCNEPEGIPNHGKARCEPTACQDEMHTFRFEWDRSGDTPELRWYIDGRQTFSIKRTPELAAAWDNFTNHAGFDLTLNIAMGGAFPDSRNYGGGPTTTTKPGGQLIVDYVRVSVRGGDGSEPAPAPAPSASATSQPTPTTSASPAPTPTAQPTSQPGTDPAPTVWQVEEADVANGLVMSAGGDFATFNNGDSACFNEVNLGEAPQLLQLRLKTDAPEGVSGFLRVRTGSATGSVIGELSVGYGGPTQWVTLPLDVVPPLTGPQTICVTTEADHDKPYVDVDSMAVTG